MSSAFKIYRSTPPQVDLPVDLNGNFRFLLFKLIWADQLADLPPCRSASDWQFQISTVRVHIADQLTDLPPYNWHLVVKNGNFAFLLLEFILADQLPDLPPKLQCIMGCILWDIFGSHCGFFKKRWEFAFTSK